MSENGYDLVFNFIGCIEFGILENKVLEFFLYYYFLGMIYCLKQIMSGIYVYNIKFLFFVLFCVVIFGFVIRMVFEVG